jgi:hypothetical protein
VTWRLGDWERGPWREGEGETNPQGVSDHWRDQIHEGRENS